MSGCREGRDGAAKGAPREGFMAHTASAGPCRAPNDLQPHGKLNQPKEKVNETWTLHPVLVYLET